MLQRLKPPPHAASRQCAVLPETTKRSCPLPVSVSQSCHPCSIDAKREAGNHPRGEGTPTPPPLV